jgi:hypothetical protein
MALKRFSAQEIATIKSVAARGASGKEIAVTLKRTVESIRARCCGLGVNPRPPKRQWHRLRILIEPMLNKALVLAARRRGMRAGAAAFNIGHGLRLDRHYLGQDSVTPAEGRRHWCKHQPCANHEVGAGAAAATARLYQRATDFRLRGGQVRSVRHVPWRQVRENVVH